MSTVLIHDAKLSDAPPMLEINTYYEKNTPNTRQKESQKIYSYYVKNSAISFE